MKKCPVCGYEGNEKACPTCEEQMETACPECSEVKSGCICDEIGKDDKEE